AELDTALAAMRSLSIRSKVVDWAALRRTAMRNLADAEAQSAADADPVIEHVVGQLGDHHSSLSPAHAVAAAADGQLQTLGITVLYPEGTVAAVAPGGPADRAGIHSGDHVSAVDAHPLVNHRGLAAIPDA